MIQKIRESFFLNEMKKLRSDPVGYDVEIPFDELSDIYFKSINEAKSGNFSINKQTKFSNTTEKSFYLTFHGRLFEELCEWGSHYFKNLLQPGFIIESVRSYYTDNCLALSSGLHIDTEKDLRLDNLLYKTIIIPYKINDNFDIDVWKNSKTIFMNQYYDHNGCWYTPHLSRDEYWQLTNPELIENKIDSEFDKIVWEDELSHIPYETLNGFNVNKIIQWKPGSIIILDRTQLHTSNNYIKCGIKKRGLLHFMTKMEIF